MNRAERAIVLWTFGYLIVYVPYFVFSGLALVSPDWTVQSKETLWRILIGLHLFGMVQCVAALVVTIRDVYARPFPEENQKLTWMLLILFLGIIFWPVYIFRYGLKPRQGFDSPPGDEIQRN